MFKPLVLGSRFSLLDMDMEREVVATPRSLSSLSCSVSVSQSSSNEENEDLWRLMLLFGGDRLPNMLLTVALFDADGGEALYDDSPGEVLVDADVDVERHSEKLSFAKLRLSEGDEDDGERESCD